MRFWQPTALLLVALAAALWLWLRDLSWMQDHADAWLLSLCLPFAWHCGRPWKLSSSSHHPLLPFALGALALVLGGLVLSVAFLLALGWTLFLFGVARSSFVSDKAPSLLRLAPLALLATPWIILDGQTIGWLFRYSGAWVNEGLFEFLGLNVERRGVYLLVENFELRVDQECAGLNNLQAMLAVGGAIAYQRLGLASAHRYWLAWLALPILAWVANSIRIFSIGIAALAFGPEFASGSFHELGGLITLGLMFLVTLGLFRLMTSPPLPPSTQVAVS